MKYTIDKNSEINGFYDDDFPETPEGAVDLTEEEYNKALSYQSQGLAMCVTKGKITGERRPNLYSHWSAAGEWVENAEEKTKYLSESINKQIADIDAQIADLEAKTYRPLREIQLGLDADGTALAKLTEYNKQITDLRTKRAKLAAKLTV